MTKPPYKSSAIWGIATSFASAVGLAVSVGAPLPLREQARGAIQALTAAGLIGGSGVAIRGRTVAKEPISWSWGKSTPATERPDPPAIDLEALMERFTTLTEQIVAQHMARSTIVSPLSTAAADVPQELAAMVASLPSAEGPTSTEDMDLNLSDLVGNVRVVAIKPTKLKTHIHTAEGPWKDLAVGDVVLATRWRWHSDRKHLELALSTTVNNGRFFVFAEHIDIKDENNASVGLHFTDPEQPWHS